jgi:hypothetical protein
MKKLLIVLVALVLLLAVVTIAQAQNFVVLPYADGQTYSIPAGESAQIAYAGWLTCNRGLNIAYMNAFNLELSYADGSPLYQLTGKNDPYWWDNYKWEEPPVEGCIPESPNYEVWWVYPITLPPGEYNITWSAWLDHKIPDGFDGDNNGLPDFYEGHRSEGTFTLIFEAAP